jgi:hypothetical protein
LVVDGYDRVGVADRSKRLFAVSGRALVPTPAAGSSECDDAGTWVLCSDGKWHNGGEVLPQCPAGGGAGREVLGGLLPDAERSLRGDGLRQWIRGHIVSVP